MLSDKSYISPYRDIIQLHRPVSRRVCMPISHRAKQFAPFAALKGFDQSICQTAEAYVPHGETTKVAVTDHDFC